jgi:hypothetical protein
MQDNYQQDCLVVQDRARATDLSMSRRCS